MARGLVFLLMFSNLFVWLVAAQNPRGRYLEVNYFDVGQGDAALIQSPQGVQVLIDGGPDSGVLEKLGQAMPFYDRDIDWVVLSHPDRDHLSGLLAVLKNYRVHNILWAGISNDTAENQEWLNLIAAEGANIMTGLAGEEFDLGGEPRLTLQVLAPEANAVAAGTGVNEASVVVRAAYGARSFVFTGDADSEGEQAVIDGVSELRADVLKVAHHGSKYSANEEFLADLMPAAAVISVGAGNSYGHPTAEVLEMLAKYDIKVLRTDQGGDIKFGTDGEQIFLRTEE